VQLKNKINEAVGSPAISRIILPSDDRMRMTRLYEEVSTRLEEMAMITARTLKMNATAGSVIRFNPLEEDGGLEFGAVEIVTSRQGHGCYDYRDGACFRTVAPKIDCEVQQ
jgi:hypothetical protein